MMGDMNSSRPIVHHVAPEQVQKTLIQALRQWLPGESWSELRKLLGGNRVQVNGNLCCDEGRRLKGTDVVRIMPHPQSAPPTAASIKIRYLDGDVVVVEKPSGMTTLRHAEERNWPERRKQLQPTLDESIPRAIEQYTTSKRGSSHQQKRPTKRTRVRAVHRLDRDTSGLMVFARTPEAEQHLIKQFSKHTVHRVYQAIALGEVKEATFESVFVRDRGDGLRGSAPKSETAKGEEGQRAVTHVKPIESLDGYTVVECRLETGRTHQIRIHLSEAGHMLCGEKMYDQLLVEKRKVVDPSGAPRIALHARELGFVHPTTGEELSFKSPWPKDLEMFLERLRGGSRNRSGQ